MIAFCQGLVTGTGGTSSTLGYLGAVYNKSNWTSMADFAVNNVGGSASGGHIVTTTSGAGTFSNQLQMTDTTRLYHVKLVLAVHMTTTESASTYGVSLGLFGVNSYSQCSFAMFYNMSTSNNGHIQFFNQNQSTTWTQQWGPTATSTVTNSTNDKIIMTFERVSNLMHFVVYNATTNSAPFDTTFSITPQGIPMPNTCVPTIWANGGNLQIDSLVEIKNEQVGAMCAIVGDSKADYGASNVQNTFPYILGYNYPSIVVQSGLGDLTGNYLSGWPEIKALKPKIVIYEGGSNDLRFSVSSLVTVANVKAFHDSCVAYGIQFIPVSPMYEVTLDVSSQISLFASYSPNIYVWDLSKMPGFLYTDNIHPGDIGMVRIARRIRESNLLQYPNMNFECVPNSNTPYTKY